ncbi:hypothetical protein GCM10028822_03280 [Hymenobacter terrigena]
MPFAEQLLGLMAQGTHLRGIGRRRARGQQCQQRGGSDTAAPPKTVIDTPPNHPLEFSTKAFHPA